jgi:hypothetical protein
MASAAALFDETQVLRAVCIYSEVDEAISVHRRDTCINENGFGLTRAHAPIEGVAYVLTEGGHVGF